MGKMQAGGRKLDFLNKLGIFASFLIITVISVYVYSPIIGTHADESLKTKLTAKIEPVISVALDTNNLSFDITPSPNGTFDSESIIATVDTNSLDGYELYFSSEDNSNNIPNIDSPNNVISSNFSDTVTSSTMENNTWGYSLNENSYNAIPVVSTQAKIKDLDHFPSSSERNTTVHIGVKIAANLIAGTYRKNVVFSAVAHHFDTFYNITKMQEMNPAICATATTPSTTATALDWDGSHRGDTSYVPRTKLEDTRDGNYYLVSKLADGNCWMSQNLALDLTAGVPVEIANHDGTTSMATPDNTTQTEVDTLWVRDETVWRSYHPKADSVYLRQGKIRSSVPTSYSDEYLWEKTGNYYNWIAASAGGVVSSNNLPTTSICPKGWRLPLDMGSTYPYNIPDEKSYHNLLVTIYGFSQDDKSILPSLISAPFNFVYSGEYYSSSNSTNPAPRIDYFESGGIYNTLSDGNYASFFRTSWAYSVGSSGYVGRSVRCIAL